MFNWKPSTPPEGNPIERIEAAVVALKADIDALRARWETDRADLWRSHKDTADTLNRMSNNPENARLAALEARFAELWGLLTEESNAGRPRLSRFGRTFKKRL